MSDDTKTPQEKEALRISDGGVDVMKKFLDGFMKFTKEREEENRKFVIEEYSKMNNTTLIWNAVILQEELMRRMKK